MAGHAKAGCLPRGTESLTSSANARNLELKGSHLGGFLTKGQGREACNLGEGPAVSAEERQCWLPASSVSSAAKSSITCSNILSIAFSINAAQKRAWGDNGMSIIQTIVPA